MKNILWLVIFVVSNEDSLAQFKTTFTHDVNGNRITNVTTAQSGDVMNNALSVQSLVGNQATFKWQNVITVSNYKYEYSGTPTIFTTNATNVILTVPTNSYFQFVLSNGYANRCVVADWKNLRTGLVESVTSGDWHTPFAWNCDCTPTSLNIATIKNGHTITIDGREGYISTLNLLGMLNFLNSGNLGFGK